MMDTSFVDAVRQRFDPYDLRSGTEQIGPLLYTLVRIRRCQTIVEYGSGYTTFFLLRALADNLADFERERRELIAKSKDFPIPDVPPDDWPIHPGFREWLGRGREACHVDPSHYLEPYRPRLFSFDSADPEGPYVANVRATAAQLQLDSLMTYHPGRRFDASLIPAEHLPIGMAWNDDDHYEEFFRELWPRLSPEGGLMALHNTAGRHKWADALAWCLQQRSGSDDLEHLTLHEPHKLGQNSCSILRRTTRWPETRFSMRRTGRIATSLRRLLGRG